MEAQIQPRISERRGPDKRLREERRIGPGLRMWIRRRIEFPVEDERRMAVRRMDSTRRGDTMRRSHTRRTGERRIT